MGSDKKIKGVLRMGVIGCARIADKYTLSAIKSSTYTHLVAVASRSKEKAEKFAQKFGCEPVYGYENIVNRQDIDAVYIPLPPILHEKWAIESLKAGKHVLNEKPFTVDFSSAQRVVDQARRQGLLVMENFMFVHHPQHTFVMNVVESGTIGEIRILRASFGFPPLAENDFRYNKNLGGGALLDVGGYVIRSVRLFLGDELTGIGAHIRMDKTFGVDIYGSAMYKNNKDQIAQVSFGFDNYYQCNYMLWGNKGAIYVKQAFTIPPSIPPEVTVEEQGLVKTFTLAPADHFQRTLDYFCKEASNNSNYEFHYSSILKQAQLIEYVKSQSCYE